MKRIISVLLILAMLFSYCIIAQSAGIVHDMSSLAKYSGIRCTNITDYGIAGMDENIAVQKFSCVAEGYTDSNWYGSSTWKNMGYGGYLVFDMYLCLDENVTAFYLGTNGHNNISEQVYAGSGYETMCWFRYSAVLDGSSNTVSTYINGNCVSENQNTNFNTEANGTKYNNIRLIFNGKVPGNAWVYDYKMYESDTEPYFSNDLYLEGFLNDTAIQAKEGSSFDSLCTPSVADANIKIYEDSTYKYELGKDEVFSEGNIIFMEYNGICRCYYVDIDNGILIEDVIEDGTITVQRGVSEKVNGIFGKEQSDVSQKIITDSTLACFSTYTWLNDDFEGYIRADFNIEPGNVSEIYIGTNVHKPVSEPLSLFSNRWNRVSVIYNTADYNRETGTGVAVTYVNGVKVSTVETIFTHMGQIRLIITGNAGSYVYVDDFEFSTHCYKAPPVPCGDELSDDTEIVNGYAMPPEGTKVGDVSAKKHTSAVRVFSDFYCTKELGADDIIELGNCIVVETAEKVYSYYVAYDAGNTNILYDIEDTNDGFSLVRGSCEGIKGFGGKSSNDESLKLTVTQESEGGVNAFNDYLWTNDGFDGYLTAEFNVYTASAGMAIATNYHTTIIPDIKNLIADRWNRVTAIFDCATLDGTNGKVYLYVNGEYAGVYTTIFKSGMVLRLIVDGRGEIGNYLYFDDYRIYETDSLPVVSVPDLGEYYSLSENYVVFENDTTPMMLSAGRLTLRVYSDDSFSALVEDEKKIISGNMVVAEDSFGTLTYYTVTDEVFKTTLLSADDYTNKPKALKIVDAAVAASNGIHGRDVSDECMELTLTNTNAYFQYDYKSPSSDRYVVVEASVYTDCDGSYKIGTNGHAPMSAVVNVRDESGYKNQWSRLVYIFDKDTKNGEIYLNGNYAGSFRKTDFPSDTNYALRFIYNAYVGAKVWIDDVHIYECNVKPTVAKAAVVPSGIKYLLFNSDLYLPSDVRYSQIKSYLEIDDEETEINIYRNGESVAVNPDEPLPDGSFMTLKKNGSLNTAYNVYTTKDNTAFFYGKMGKSDKLADGELKIAVPVKNMNDLPMITVALYKGGKLVSVDTAESDGFGKYVKYNLNVVSEDIDSVKVMVWDYDSLMPLSKNGKIE